VSGKKPTSSLRKPPPSTPRHNGHGFLSNTRLGHGHNVLISVRALIRIHYTAGLRLYEIFKTLSALVLLNGFQLLIKLDLTQGLLCDGHVRIEFSLRLEGLNLETSSIYLVKTPKRLKKCAFSQLALVPGKVFANLMNCGRKAHFAINKRNRLSCLSLRLSAGAQKL
jgi:hypothetical protein